MYIIDSRPISYIIIIYDNVYVWAGVFRYIMPYNWNIHKCNTHIMTLSSDGSIKTLVELWRFNRTWRNTFRENIFKSKNVCNAAMYHQNKFQVCISKNNERRAKKPSLTIYLNILNADRQTDRHLREGWNIDIWSIWKDFRQEKIFLKHDLYDQTWQTHNAHCSERTWA